MGNRNLYSIQAKVIQVAHKLTKIFFSFHRAKRFSQNFIDIREKERKRGARGLVTVPTKTELLGNETSVDNATIVTTMSPEEQAKAEDMLKLQQKITQELLNSNLKENERNELQVSEYFFPLNFWCQSKFERLQLMAAWISGENQQRNSELKTFPRQCGREYRSEERWSIQAIVNQGAVPNELAQ